VLTTDDLPRQGLGCMTMTEETLGDPDRDPGAVVRAALDAGVSMVDTAHLYGNEALVGRAIAGRRDEVLLATKFGVLWRGEGDWYVRADAPFVRESCEASLRRLGVDAIDLYYLHHRSDTTPVEETVGAMAELVREGKVRGIGLSNVTAEDLRRAHAVHPVLAVQERWSLTHRDAEAVVPAAAALGVAVVAYSPTDHGSLHAGGGGGAVAAVADRHGVPAGRVALAWVHHRADRWRLPVVPLPGTTSVRHLRDNAAAADLVLTGEDLAELDAAPGASPTAP
jgi:aryl-alcohol dehydrogenase-like predicted oxidoreductase